LHTHFPFFFHYSSGNGNANKGNVDEEATVFIKELLSVPVLRLPFGYVDQHPLQNDDANVAEGCNNEVEVYKMTRFLQSDEGLTTRNLVIPPGTSGAWKSLLADTKSKRGDASSNKLTVASQRYLVIGSPGVGKSRSMNYLIKLIITERRTVHDRPLPTIVFEHRKDEKVWIFSPKEPNSQQESEYEVQSFPLAEFSKFNCEALKNPDNFYLIDSAMAENSNYPGHVPAVTVFVCSPDTRHYSEYKKHMQKGSTYYIPVWPDGALAAAREYMQQNDSSAISVETLRDRESVVGSIPRRVFCDESTFDEWKKTIDRTMRSKELSVRQVLLDGVVDLEVEVHKDKPMSSVFCFYSDAADKFRKATPQFVSNYARDRMTFNTFTYMYNRIANNKNPDNSVNMGKDFEWIVFKLLHSGWTTKMTHLKDPSKKKDLVVLAGAGPIVVEAAEAGIWKKIEGKMQAMNIIPATATTTDTTTAAPIFFGSNFPMIDAADARNRGFSVTVAKTKRILTPTLLKLRSRLQLSDGELLQVVLIIPHSSDVPNVTFDEEAFAGKANFFVAHVPSPFDSNGGSDFWRQIFMEQNETPSSSSKSSSRQLSSVVDSPSRPFSTLPKSESPSSSSLLSRSTTTNISSHLLSSPLLPSRSFASLSMSGMPMSSISRRSFSAVATRFVNSGGLRRFFLR
jgi:energy-coupling factor transporter ATP-binding protein EcfA2